MRGRASATDRLAALAFSRTLVPAAPAVPAADDAAPESLYKAKLEGAMGMVLGAEGEGLRRLTRDSCDLLVSIPMMGAVESLNVSVASGICLYEARRRRLAA